MNMNMNTFINNQPIINIGCLGSVSDGKSTLIRTLTGIKTQKHSSEKIRNITIKQGYGNMKIWEDKTTTTSDITHDDLKLINHISFVDCPGHQDYIQTMLASISIMDGAIVVIATDQPLSNKPQLLQHLEAAMIGKIKNIIICLNKIDLVTRTVLMTRKNELDLLLEKYQLKPFAIIPTSFNKNIGVNYLIDAIIKLFNPEQYIERSNSDVLFRISRTFDINKPGTDWDKVIGGVLGGSLVTGKLKVGDKIEIRPGMVWKENNKLIYQPITTIITSIKTDTNELQECIPGGLIGLGTDLDPYYCKNDMLLGNIAIKQDNKNDSLKIYTNINISYSKWKPTINELLVLQIGTRVVDSKVIEIKDNIINVELSKPVCIPEGQHIIICKKINNILKIISDSHIFF